MLDWSKVGKKYSIEYLLENDPDVVAKSLEKRGLDPGIAYRGEALLRQIKSIRRSLDELRGVKNRVSKYFAVARDKDFIRDIARSVDGNISGLEDLLRRLEGEYREVLNNIPNIVSSDVPVGPDDSFNKVLRYHGRPRVFEGDRELFIKSYGDIGFEAIGFKPVGHADWGEKSGLVDTLRAGKTSGSRFYYMYSDLVLLDLALTMYALEYLMSRGYIPVEPPYMVRRRVMEGAAFFEAFKETLYSVCDEDLYLIATSEQSLAGLYMDEVLERRELPIKLAGWSPCFRREAGAHGKDTKGIFRVHQFNKVEQFIFSAPEESESLHEELIRNSEELYKGLGIPYRVVVISSGEMNRLAVKQYDLEGWMPAQVRYRELVSASNCTDWQAYRLNIRYAEERGKEIKGYVHTLNCTAIASQRTITAIIENFQDEEGYVEIPKRLMKYLEAMGYKESFIKPIKLPGGKP